MGNKTWITEANALMVAVVALLLALGVTIPQGVSEATIVIVNIVLRVGIRYFRKEEVAG